MTTKDIRTTQAHVSCDVCGRTLLRGERAETYIAGGTRREVCELCQPRALHEGWVREDAVLERGPRSAPGERRRSLLSRLRRPRSDEAGGHRGAEDHHGHEQPARPASSRVERVERMEPQRELRQVKAVPTSVEQRVASAIEHFNVSEHTRTVSGVARSLGAPVVVVRPLEEPASIVTVVVSWELCWYRYEVDLDGGSVRTAGQGYELEELEPPDRIEANAAADEFGRLTPA